MKRGVWVVLAVVATVLLFAGAIRARRALPVMQTDVPSVELGQRLVNTIGCDDCHTPFVPGPDGPEPDMTRRLSGHPQSLVMPVPPKLVEPWGFIGAMTNTAFAGPWGISYTANLTPDENTGLGIWTEEMFLTALREGRHMGQSREIQPPMPWKFYRNLTDHELKSIYAFLRTLPPIVNQVPEYCPPEQIGGDADFWSLP